MAAKKPKKEDMFIVIDDVEGAIEGPMPLSEVKVLVRELADDDYRDDDLGLIRIFKIDTSVNPRIDVTRETTVNIVM